MKKSLFFLAILVSGILAYSCTRIISPDSPIRSLDENSLFINLDDAGDALSALPDCNTVSLGDIHKYVGQYYPTTKSGDVDYTIEPIVDKDNDTLMFVVRYNKGWELISSDRRVQPILAIDYESDYQEVIKDNGVSLWMSMMALDMKAIIHASDDELTIPKEEQERNKRYWESFCNVNDFVKANISRTKSGGGPDHPPIPWNDGEYVLDTTIARSARYDSIAHLIPLYWAQTIGTNDCCPYRTDNPSLHAPAGCVSIAAGQVLYYLHYHLGVPMDAPSTGACTGNVDNYGPPQLGNWSSEVWDSMSEGGNTFCAPFIAEVGWSFDVTYHNTETSLNPSELSRNKFWSYNIDCDSSLFNANTVYTSLLGNSPVIVSAFGTRIPHFLAPDTYTNGHAFIIDAYRRDCTEFTRIYKWVYFDQTIPHLIAPEDSIAVTYENPYLAFFQMNWGHGYGRGNGIWFAATGNWYYLVEDENGQTAERNYIYDRKMLYNFRIRQ